MKLLNNSDVQFHSTQPYNHVTWSNNFESIQKRSHKAMYKPNTDDKAKMLKTTTFTIAQYEEQ